jgi:phage repressor protein C with HTH and peptisase S24 domain
MNYKVEKLLNGETFVTREKGNSMLPLIKSGQEHVLEPAKWEDVNVGDIVYCKVKGRLYTHLVKAKNNDRGCLIGNNKGNINGWTKQVYGKVIEVI